MARKPGERFPSDHRRWFRVTEDILDDPKFNGDAELLGFYIRILATLNRTKGRDGILRLSDSTLKALFDRSQITSARKVLGKLVRSELLSAAKYPTFWLILVPKWPEIQEIAPEKPHCSPNETPATTPTPKTTPRKNTSRAIAPSNLVGLDAIIRCRERLVSALLRASPDHRVARKRDFAAWDRDFDLLLRVDGRSEPEVVSMIEWALSHDFWAPNIQSPKKLREKWDTLAMQRKRDSVTRLSPTQARIERGHQAVSQVVAELEGRR